MREEVVFRNGGLTLWILDSGRAPLPPTFCLPLLDSPACVTILRRLQPAPGNCQGHPPPLPPVTLWKEGLQELLHFSRASLEELWGCEPNNYLGRVKDPFTHQSKNLVGRLLSGRN